MNKKRYRSKIKLLTILGIIIGAICIVSIISFCTKRCMKIPHKKIRMKPSKKQTIQPSNQVNNDGRHVYFIGGGLASLAGAAYLIRDCNFMGGNIHIIEGMKVIGGSNDASGDAISGFISRGGRMLNEETYENFWELFSSIPSLEKNGKSVTEEILNFDHQHPVHAQARVIDKNGIIQDVTKMGFNNEDLLSIGKLIITPNKLLEDLTIENWFQPHFFETNFWLMWQTTFAFQKWSSVSEFKRYLERMLNEFSRIQTLEGVTHTPYNQYESVILPLKAYLQMHAVEFCTNQTVVDLDFKTGDEITVTAIHIKQNENGSTKTIQLNYGDVCIVTNGCMTDCSTLGDLTKAPDYNINKPMGAELWRKIAKKKPNLGNPDPFFEFPDETNWESFTITCKGNKLIKMIESFSTNIPGSGTLMTFRDSNWLLSIIVPAQPYFKAQPIDTTILWGYGLHTNKMGNYIKKQMKDCNGEEILTEIIYHLHMENELKDILKTVVNVIPCMMPYIGAQFQPHKISDRPNVVPKGSTNFAMISQFVEIPGDMVFTEEYSVRAARTAIYTLFHVENKKVCPVTPYKRNIKVIKRAVKTVMK